MAHNFRHILQHPTQFYTTLHKHHKTIQICIRLYTASQNSRKLYTTLQNYILELYTTSENFTKHYKTIQDSTKLFFTTVFKTLQHFAKLYNTKTI